MEELEEREVKGRWRGWVGRWYVYLSLGGVLFERFKGVFFRVMLEWGVVIDFERIKFLISILYAIMETARKRILARVWFICLLN